MRRGVAFGRQAIDDGSTGIAQAEQFPDFVISFPNRIIAGCPQNRVIAECRDVDKLGMPTRDEERDVGLEGRHGPGVVAQQRREQMPFKVMNADQRSVERQRQTSCHLHTDEQSTDQSRPFGGRDELNVSPANRRIGERLFDDRHTRRKVMAACELRNNASKRRMHIHLGADDTAQNDSISNQRRRRFVTGAFESENQGHG